MFQESAVKWYLFPEQTPVFWSTLQICSFFPNSTYAVMMGEIYTGRVDCQTKAEMCP